MLRLALRFLLAPGRSATEVYAGSARGSVFRFDGSRWTHLGNPVRRRLVALAIVDGGVQSVSDDLTVARHTSVHASSPNAVWAAANGELLHWDGAQWSRQDHGVFDFPSLFRAVRVDPSGRTWAFGWQATIIRRR